MTAQVQEKSRTRRVPVRIDAGIAAAAVAAALVGWVVLTQVGGMDLTVRSGSGTQTVGATATVASAAIAATGGILLLRFLETRSAIALRTWTILAVLVFLISLLGPLGATTSEAGLGLASMHLLVAATLVAGLRRVRRTQLPAA